MNHKVAEGHLFQSRLERCDEVRRKVPDEPDRVRQEQRIALGQIDLPCGRVQSGKGHSIDQKLGTG